MTRNFGFEETNLILKQILCRAGVITIVDGIFQQGKEIYSSDWCSVLIYIECFWILAVNVIYIYILEEEKVSVFL